MPDSSLFPGQPVDTIQTEEPSRPSPYWDFINKVTFSAAMTTIAIGNHFKNPDVRASGFGGIAAKKAEKSIEEIMKAAKGVTGAKKSDIISNLTGTIGTALWAGGIAVESQALVTVGPALNFLGNAVSTGMKYWQNDSDWFIEAIDAAENFTFAFAGYSGHPAARAVAFAVAAAGHACDALKNRDKMLFVHAVGAVAWSIGAGTSNVTPQVVGPSLIAAAEIGRIEKIAGAAASFLNRVKDRSVPTEPVLPMHTASPSPAISMNTPAQASESSTPPPVSVTEAQQSDIYNIVTVECGYPLEGFLPLIEPLPQEVAQAASLSASGTSIAAAKHSQPGSASHIFPVATTARSASR
ncbi:hypothetical protein ACFV2D_37995 [Streptomyces capillispiralis]|uniref:hypothetical protein n=1 Tax=Streptomyces capillispiralis TaxID=68182 RepID=UPI0036BD5A06